MSHILAGKLVRARTRGGQDSKKKPIEGKLETRDVPGDDTLGRPAYTQYLVNGYLVDPNSIEALETEQKGITEIDDDDEVILKATSSRAKELLGIAKDNLPAKHTAEDRVKSHVAVWLGAHRKGDHPDDISHVEHAIHKHGGEAIGREGEVTTNDPRVHHSPSGNISTGAKVRVIRKGWGYKHSDGRFLAIHPATVEPAND